jgi:hypothetical protein
MFKLFLALLLSFLSAAAIGMLGNEYLNLPSLWFVVLSGVVSSALSFLYAKLFNVDGSKLVPIFGLVAGLLFASLSLN